MVKGCKVEVLSSKRLTKSFHQIEDFQIWQSISLSLEEAKGVIANALDKITGDSEPLTITVTVLKKEVKNESST